MLKKLREKCGITQTELSTSLGFSSPQFISNMERGLCQLPVKHYRKAAKLLKVSPEFFIEARMTLLRAKLNKAFKIRN